MVIAVSADKKRRLIEILKGCSALAVAFSGGVDSTFLLAAAREALGDRVSAVTVDSPIHSRREIREARAIAKALGVRHIVVPFGDITAPGFVANPPERCYTCKQLIFAEIIRVAASLGIRRVAHGVNMDDQEDYRPGLKAAQEMGVASPLAEAGLTKAEIRALSRKMQLPTWNKPSMACLASRIPYGRPITREDLVMVEQAEESLLQLGFDGSRVRHHGSVARIEVVPGDLHKTLRKEMRTKILKRLKQIGFKHVAVDLEGYVQGSLNRAIEGQGIAGAGGRGGKSAKPPGGTPKT
ncbi:MAG: ATP-dependent sacrificial sulfur transferase LarE [Desulfobacterales bacterium]|nr:ATP-dependent sacrificial sulfur transferase LarE [Desulfobacterales bacterium]